MIYVILILCILVMLMLAAVERRAPRSGWRKGRRSVSYTDSGSWDRQRWSMGTYNGRHRIDFGYFLRRPN